MGGIIKFFRGSVAFQVTGVFPERFLNLCAQEGLPFWGMEWQDAHSLTLTVHRRWRKKIPELAHRVQCEAQASQSAGLPVAFGKISRRYGFLLGLTLSVCTVCILSQFILTIELTGNETVPDEVILAELSRQGLSLGTFGPDVAEKVISQESLLQLSELSWMGINLYGTRAEVIVREKVMKPEIVDRSIPTHVVAGVTGLITKLERMEGQALFEVGDMVLEGEIIVSGIVDMPEPEYSELDLGTRITHAEANVYARTWRTLTAEIPLTAQVKCYTGETQTSWAVTFFQNYKQIYKNSGISMEQYDKIKKSYSLTLPGGGLFPVALQQEISQGYTTTAVDINQTTAQQMLETQLLNQLEGLVGEGEVRHTSFETQVTEELLIVTLVAECEEQIGYTLAFEGEVGYTNPYLVD